MRTSMLRGMSTLFRIDELEGNKTKLQMRLQEAEETIDSLHTKVVLLDSDECLC